jgi:phosphatidylserine decarboxylase
MAPETPLSDTTSTDRPEAQSTASRLPLEPPDPLITSIQPGGGVCMRLELAWGHVRRWLLKIFFPGYVERMRQLREGTHNQCPHEVLDPRDLKFYQHLPGYSWAVEHDLFAWRDRLPLVRAGLAEAIVFCTFCAIAALVAGLWRWWLSLPPLVVLLWALWFFRNPRRIAPAEAGLVVAPADGLVVAVNEIDHDDFLAGPAVEIGIFLSIFDVHINRVPVAARIIGTAYRPGKFLNALLPASARENERLTIRMEENQPPYRRFIVRQIAGAIARRIVCWVGPGAVLEQGEKFGMIKFGSRTELVLPRQPGLKLLVRVGQRLQAGATVIARYDAIDFN